MVLYLKSLTKHFVVQGMHFGRRLRIARFGVGKAASLTVSESSDSDRVANARAAPLRTLATTIIAPLPASGKRWRRTAGVGEKRVSWRLRHSWFDDGMKRNKQGVKIF
jgi:hypothetical protein